MVEFTVVGEGPPSRLSARDGMKAGGLRRSLPWHVSATSSTASCDPRLLSRVSLHREPSILSSLETPKHSTNALAPFSRGPLKLTIAFFDLISEVFQEFGPTVCVKDTQELRLYPGHNPDTLSSNASIDPTPLVLPV